jgi:hypothetical protein
MTNWKWDWEVLIPPKDLTLEEGENATMTFALNKWSIPFYDRFRRLMMGLDLEFLPAVWGEGRQQWRYLVHVDMYTGRRDEKPFISTEEGMSINLTRFEQVQRSIEVNLAPFDSRLHSGFYRFRAEQRHYHNPKVEIGTFVMGKDQLPERRVAIEAKGDDQLRNKHDKVGILTGTRGVIKCFVFGFENPVVKLRRNSSGQEVELRSPPSDDWAEYDKWMEHTYEHVLANVTSEDDDVYTCIVSDVTASVESSAVEIRAIEERPTLEGSISPFVMDWERVSTAGSIIFIE